MKQSNLEVPRILLKAGKSRNDEKLKKVSFKFNKKGKLTEKGEEEIQRTSTNIFDWFSSVEKVENLVPEGRKEEEVHPNIKQELAERDDPPDSITTSNRLGNVLRVMIGQSPPVMF